jgi:hypothetical protein
MFTKIRKRFSSAHILAAAALFVVLGGSAYAALGKNTVGSKQLKANAVKTKKIANGAVSTDKLGADAVTGDKVNESTLGKVPAAATADTATTATDATNAAQAASADDADALEGRTLIQVRPASDSDDSGVDLGLADSTFSEVLITDIGIPTGGANLIATASVELFNTAGAARNASCTLRSDGTAISQTYDVQMTNPGIPVVVTLTGYAEFATGTGISDPENVGVYCQGSIADDDVEFRDGDLVVQRIPTGTGQ